MFVYSIRNVIDNKIYIGKTSRNISKRWSDHRSMLRRNSHSNKHLQSAWNKYSESAFKFEIIEKFDSGMNFDLNNLERFWIKHYDSNNPKKGYNFTEGGEGTLGFKLSEDTKQKISLKLKNKPLSKKHKEAISYSMKGKSGDKSSRSKKVVCLNNQTTYDSIRIAAKELNLNQSHISQVCKGKYRHTKGFSFSYLRSV